MRWFGWPPCEWISSRWASAKVRAYRTPAGTINRTARRLAVRPNASPGHALHHQRHAHHQRAADQVVPEERDLGEREAADHGRLGGECRHEHRRPAHAPQIEGGEED